MDNERIALNDLKEILNDLFRTGVEDASKIV